MQGGETVLSGLRSILRNRQLIWALTQRELARRYRGSLLGLAWLVLLPALTLGVYTFVFRYVFIARIPVAATQLGAGAFALYVFLGLMIFTIVAETLTRAPTLMLENVSYIKKIKFPLEILPVVITLASLTIFMVSLALWLALHLAMGGLPPAQTALLPLAVAPLALMALGATFFLASIGVFLRDLKEVVGPLVTMFMFLSPVFYAQAAAPEAARPYLALNPIGVAIEQARDMMFEGRAPQASAVALQTALGAAAALLGLWWFQKTRKGFADVV